MHTERIHFTAAVKQTGSNIKTAGSYTICALSKNTFRNNERHIDKKINIGIIVY